MYGHGPLDIQQGKVNESHWSQQPTPAGWTTHCMVSRLLSYNQDDMLTNVNMSSSHDGFDKSNKFY